MGVQDFIPSHADEGSTKDMRLVTTKGKVTNGRIRWLRNREEFESYVKTLTTCSRKRPREDLEEPEAKKQKLTHYIYILKEIDGIGTYVGETPYVQQRLEQHNAGKGSQLTAGRKWEILHLLEGTVNEKQSKNVVLSLKNSCKKLEAALKHQRTLHYSDWGTILEELLAKKAWQHIKRVEL